MIRFVSLVLSFAFVFGQTLLVPDRTLTAEGDYIAQTKTGDKPLAHWQLWHLGDGDYEVVDTSVKNASSVQIFRFGPQFLPIGYNKKFGPTSEPQIPNFPTIPGWAIACQYASDELSCDAESSEGHKSKTSIAAEPPYVFIGEFYDLDFAWFMTGVVRLASRGGAKGGVVNVYAMTDGAKVGDIGLKPDVPMKIVFAGEETARVMGKEQVVKKYEWGADILRVTAQGLVVSLSNKSDPAIGFGISNYKEYEPWGAPILPALPATPSPEPPANPIAATDSTLASAPIGRIKVSSGVMAGLLLHKVQPIYPESARQNHIQGAVVLGAVIGKDGHIVELKSISGPAELIPATITAVRQWEYRPYIFSGSAAEVETQIQVNFVLSH